MVQSPVVKDNRRTYKYLKPIVGTISATYHEISSAAIGEAESMYLWYEWKAFLILVTAWPRN
jgi:hypothetical protein